MKNIEEKIVKGAFDFYNTYLNEYVSAYFSWLTKLLSGTEPFAVLAISICLFFALMVYIWFRNRNA